MSLLLLGAPARASIDGLTWEELEVVDVGVSADSTATGPAGANAWRWDLRDGEGRRSAAGSYFVLARSSTGEVHKRVLIVR